MHSSFLKYDQKLIKFFIFSVHSYDLSPINIIIFLYGLLYKKMVHKTYRSNLILNFDKSCEGTTKIVSVNDIFVEDIFKRPRKLDLN